MKSSSNEKYADLWLHHHDHHKQTLNDINDSGDSENGEMEDLPPYLRYLNNMKNLQKFDGVFSPLSDKQGEMLDKFNQHSQELTDRSDLLMTARSEHLKQQSNHLQERTRKIAEDLTNVGESWQKVTSPQQAWQAWLSYASDSTKRLFQTADVLRERGDIFIEHEEAGCPPVLDYDYEVILDGSTFNRPSNYVLLKILAPKGIETKETRRPYIIIDPRAGHGAGIGGFKHDSQVGVALNDGHPVYFVAFKCMPEPGQTIADVTYAEAKFVREVRQRHPESNPPVVVGNCQGGWAALILAATNPDITGPIVMNGSPVAAWSGEVGVNPMRYNGGVQGTTWLAMLTSDLGNGIFDGAWLVHNFEKLNPSRNYVGKYYDLYKNPVKNRDRFLGFERWWGGFFLMNEEEIRWIVENIFIGNRIARNTAQLEKGTNIDIKNIKAPIIVFASHGDNITPPQQALNWILDTYTDEREIEICGQRIVYMVHEKVGHLGIFVSSSIAKREHKGMASILKMIETLPPGLFELVLEDYEGEDNDMQFYVTFQRRTFDDLSLIDDGRLDEKPFKAVHRMSKAQARSYENLMRPWVQSMSNEQTATMLRHLHPLRLQRRLWSSKNPYANMMSLANNIVSKTNEEKVQDINVSTDQKPQHILESMNATSANLTAIESLQQDNPFLQLEKLWMNSIITSLDIWRDWQAMTQEILFYSMWTMPWMRQYGRSEVSRRLASQEALKEIPAVETALENINSGGFKEAVVRMLILTNMMTESGINRDKLMLITEILGQSKPFTDLNQEELAKIMHEQTIIVRFDKEQAMESLARMLTRKADREKAAQTVRFVIGKYEDMPIDTRRALSKLHEVLKLEELDDDNDVLSNPLKTVTG